MANSVFFVTLYAHLDRNYSVLGGVGQTVGFCVAYILTYSRSSFVRFFFPIFLHIFLSYFNDNNKFHLLGRTVIFFILITLYFLKILFLFSELIDIYGLSFYVRFVFNQVIIFLILSASILHVQFYVLSVYHNCFVLKLGHYYSV